MNCLPLVRRREEDPCGPHRRPEVKPDQREGRPVPVRVAKEKALAQLRGRMSPRQYAVVTMWRREPKFSPSASSFDQPPHRTRHIGLGIVRRYEVT